MNHISTSELQTVSLMQNDEEHDSRSAPEPRLGVGKKTIVDFRIRLFLFVLMEASFIALASVCLARPLPLTLGFSESKIKGGFTVIFIVWHSLAVFAGGNITIDAFSREWSVQSEQIIPGTTDKVSTINSGWMDRTSHSISKHASGTFRLAFLASLSLMVLGQLAPGTISVSTITISVPTTVRVAKQVSQTGHEEYAQFLSSITRANIIIRLEKTEHTPFGFQLPANTLISLPPTPNKFNGTLEYDTDIVEFHHNCRWEAPSFDREFSLVSAAGKTWDADPIFGDDRETLLGSSIRPLSNFGNLVNTSTSAYLFIGGNSSFDDPVWPSNPWSLTKKFTINLGNLPNTYVEQDVGITAESGPQLVGPLASVLVCDPQPMISGGRVRLENNGTVSVISSGQPPDGSFPSTAANLILSNAFHDALVEPEIFEGADFINNVAADMFMANNSADWQLAQNIAPLDIPSINKNVDDFMSSAAKAFIYGYRKLGTSVHVTFDSASVPGLIEEQRLALTTSQDLFIVTVVLDMIITVLLCTLVRSAPTWKGVPLNLANFFRLLSEGHTKERRG